MANDKAYLVPNPIAPTQPILIDPDKCTACNKCTVKCRVQTLLPNPEKGKPPVVVYPEECWYCGCCIEECKFGAMQMRYPINQRLFFKRKDTGEIFRVGGPDAPPQSYFKPTVGDEY
ncbi:MAG: ferredoxin family protein [Oscillospiraceae bacterium]|nr:ferredoxin family protein [Oscillospiraceae bacterium]